MKKALLLMAVSCCFVLLGMERDPFSMVEYATYQSQGTRKSQEDAFSLTIPKKDKNNKHETVILNSIEKTATLSGAEESKKFFAVLCDGHNGKQVSTYAVSGIVTKFFENKKEAHEDKNISIESIFHKTFEDIENDIIQDKEKRFRSAGSTAVAVYKDKDSLHIAWVGDSRAVVAQEGTIISATIDHKPIRPDEKERIDTAWIKYLQSYKELNMTVTQKDLDDACKESPVRQSTTCPHVSTFTYCGDWAKISVSRTLGTRLSKITVPGSVIAVPEYINISLVNRQAPYYLVIACDGLWDVVNNEEVVKKLDCRLTLNQIAQGLEDTARRRDSGDNVSIMILRIS